MWLGSFCDSLVKHINVLPPCVRPFSLFDLFLCLNIKRGEQIIRLSRKLILTVFIGGCSLNKVLCKIAFC